MWKDNKGIIVTDIKKENLTAHYSHFKPALEDTKNVVRILSMYFKNILNETRELATSMTTA